ncbi:hypothetical protein Mal15_42040 [Stieleria maiorica]|uniref:Uncharacterized protein n=1 Tax=Stieleria maiorica TaxID=2795974 RepID=A0A5B9MKB2_9BACT|nr:hypothetical protein Mal15_42040 [Stieleria maiorica]
MLCSWVHCMFVHTEMLSNKSPFSRVLARECGRLFDVYVAKTKSNVCHEHERLRAEGGAQ